MTPKRGEYLSPGVTCCTFAYVDRVTIGIPGDGHKRDKLVLLLLLRTLKQIMR